MRNFLLLAVVFISSCSLPPTRVSEVVVIPDWQKKQISQELEWQNQNLKDFVILDARSFFKYQLEHVEGAQHFDINHFLKQKPNLHLQKNYKFQARKLARYGIDRSSKVLVIGEGSGGEGEEAFIAWYLRQLGVENVFTLNPIKLNWKRSSQVPILNDSVKTWRPKSDFRIVDISELSNLPDPAKTVLVYLSEEREFFNQSAPSGMKVINIPWREFVSVTSQPKKEMVSKLAGIGLGVSNHFVLIHSDVKKSAAVAFYLSKLGFYSSKVLLKEK
ncbi:MAG: rhodanese-like domain-containing protein [Bdellovibrionales bacterium]